MAAQIKFTNPRKTDFYKVVTERVDRYFTENGISKNADARMWVKTACMFSFYFVPYILMLTGLLPLWGIWLCFGVMGIGLAGIGMSVMHDANHGAYSDKRWVNQLLGLSLDLVGGNSFNWRIQHNILHHTFTNIHGHDQDIRARMNLRLTPAVKHNWLHRFQIFYAFILYALQTFFWVLIKDFIQLFQYGKEGRDNLTGAERWKRFGIMFFAKSAYVIYILVIPAIILHLHWWQLLVGFMLLHAIAGLILTIVFQLAHVVEDADFPELNSKGNIDEEWAIHQMHTTANFGPRNKLLTFYVGGLNYQVEHHLFQRVCHVHYPKIAPIVKQTAEEYGIPYLSNNTFRDAFASHVRLLKKLGVSETFHMASEL